MTLTLALQTQTKHLKRDLSVKVGLASPSILLVEHAGESQQHHLHLLRLLNCKVDLATSGKQALTLSTQAYDLILMDTHLPDLCGFEVSKRIKAKHPMMRIPIIALTQQHHTPKQSHVDELVAKPVSPEKLISILTRWIH